MAMLKSISIILCIPYSPQKELQPQCILSIKNLTILLSDIITAQEIISSVKHPFTKQDYTFSHAEQWKDQCRFAYLWLT